MSGVTSQCHTTASFTLSILAWNTAVTTGTEPQVLISMTKLSDHNISYPIWPGNGGSIADLDLLVSDENGNLVSETQSRLKRDAL